MTLPKPDLLTHYFPKVVTPKIMASLCPSSPDFVESNVTMIAALAAARRPDIMHRELQGLMQAAGYTDLEQPVSLACLMRAGEPGITEKDIGWAHGTNNFHMAKMGALAAAGAPAPYIREEMQKSLDVIGSRKILAAIEIAEQVVDPLTPFRAREILQSLTAAPAGPVQRP